MSPTRTAVVVAVCAIAAFALLAFLVTHGVTQSADEAVLRSFRTPGDASVPRGFASLADVARDVTALGSVSVLVVLVGIVATYLGIRGHRGPALLVTLSALGGVAVSWALKEAVDRTRPSVVPHLQDVADESFPSGHSMESAIVYLTLGTLLAGFTQERRLRTFLIGAALFLTAIVGLSRLVLGVHYPSDVLAGWSAGIAWASICRVVALRLQQRGKVEGDAIS